MQKDHLRSKVNVEKQWHSVRGRKKIKQNYFASRNHNIENNFFFPSTADSQLPVFKLQTSSIIKIPTHSIITSNVAVIFATAAM